MLTVTQKDRYRQQFVAMLRKQGIELRAEEQAQMEMAGRRSGRPLESRPVKGNRPPLAPRWRAAAGTVL